MIHIASTTAQGPNLYPHTIYHRGLPAPGPRDTIVTMACEMEGDSELGCEDLETIAAGLLLKLQPLPDIVRAQAAVIAEAYQHDMGLIPWKPGRRGIVAPWIRGIARIALSETPISYRRAMVYTWLHGRRIPDDPWEPEPVPIVSCQHVAYVRGPLWRAWEVAPVGITEEGAIGVHPGSALRVGRVRFRAGDTPEMMIKRVFEKCR